MDTDEDPVEELLKNTPVWGKYQLLAYVSLAFVCSFSVFPLSYIFTARDVKYRCLIEGCESENTSESLYNPKWLKDFVPFEGDSPDSCHRYALMNNNNSCSKRDVLKNDTTRCKKFIYQTQDFTILHDFGLHCNENVWMLTMVGTTNMIGELVCLSYSGFFSDRYGRKTAMLINIILCCFVGIIKSFSVSYIMYLLLEFLDPALGAGMYNSAFILAMEFVAPKNRNITNIIICCLFSLGEMCVGLAAWLTPSWRIMLRVLYFPGLISLTFYWTIPESLRWLLSKKKEDEVQKIVTRFTGQKENQLLSKYLQTINRKSFGQSPTPTASETFSDAVKSKILFLRLIHCSFTWISCTFLYYGLTMHSVSISENIYLSFIFSTAVEIPAYIIYYYGNEKIGRRLMIFLSFIATGASCLAVGFIQKDSQTLRLCIFLVGKCCSTISYTIIYVFTTEMFPTCSRHAMFSVCAMMGRMGAMVAPQLPLLSRISEILPLIMFAIIACTSGTLALLFPETLNTKLPDTIQEAINIGKKRNRTTGSQGDRDGQ